MNKKIFQSALAVVTMMFGVSALAQNMLETTRDANYPRVSVGGTVVMKDQIVHLPPEINGGALTRGQTVILRLPAGTNFVGTPMAIVEKVRSSSLSPGSPTPDPQLRLADVAGDGATRVPAITTDPAIITDTNGDGGMDRAVVTVTDSGLGDDRVVFRGSISVSSAELGNLQGTLLVSAPENAEDQGGTVANRTVADSPTILAEVRPAAMTATPVALDVRAPVLSLEAGVSEFDEDDPPTHLLTIPAGYPLGQRDITVTLGGLGSLVFGGGEETPTIITVVKLTDRAPSLIAAPPTTTSLTSVRGRTFQLTTTGAPPATTTQDNQYLIEYRGGFTVSPGSAGSAGRSTSITATYSDDGSDGVNGVVTFATLSDPGTSVSLATDRLGEPLTPTDVVIGARSMVRLPSFVISGNFVGDLGQNGDSITVTPSSGLIINLDQDTVIRARAVCDDDAGNPISTISTIAPTISTETNVLTLPIVVPIVGGCTAPSEITVSGLMARLEADVDAAVSLPLTLSFLRGEMTRFPNRTVTVAQGVERGEVSVTRVSDSDMLDLVGPSSTMRVQVRLTESTYGSLLQRSGPRQTQAYIIVRPSNNVGIRSVTSDTSDSLLA